jgi:hypothetical protein
MSTICAWCERLIQRVAGGVAGGHGRAPTSHGICSACLRRQVEKK